MPARFPTYYQINLHERQIIERLYAQGYTPGKIARQVFRSRSTITREIRRNGYPDKNGQWQYSAKIAQRFCEHRQRRTGSIRGADTLNPREPSGNYIHTTPVIPVFRIRIHRGLHIELKRWFRKYQLSRWHENDFGKAWRRSNNWLRNRCHSWEEMGRRFKKHHYSPFLLYTPMQSRLQHKYKYRYKDYWRIPGLVRRTGNRLSGCRKSITFTKKRLHFPLKPCFFPNKHLEIKPVSSPKPFHRARVQRPDGITMPENRLNQRFFKIPSPA